MQVNEHSGSPCVCVSASHDATQTSLPKQSCDDWHPPIDPVVEEVSTWDELELELEPSPVDVPSVPDCPAGKSSGISSVKSSEAHPATNSPAITAGIQQSKRMASR